MFPKTFLTELITDATLIAPLQTLALLSRSTLVQLHAENNDNAARQNPINKSITGRGVREADLIVRTVSHDDTLSVTAIIHKPRNIEHISSRPV